MGNRISKWWSNTYRSCRNVTCLDDCACFSCLQRSSKLKKNERRSLTLETISMPYIDETAYINNNKMQSIDSNVNLIEMSQKLLEHITANIELHSRKEQEYEKLMKEKDEKILKLEEDLKHESWRANSFYNQVNFHKREIDNVKFEKSNYFMHLATSKSKIRNLEKDLKENSAALAEAMKTLNDFKNRIKYLEEHIDQQDNYVDFLHKQIDKYKAELGESDDDEEIVNDCYDQQQQFSDESKENCNYEHFDEKNVYCDQQINECNERNYIQEDENCEISSEMQEQSQTNSNHKSVSFDEISMEQISHDQVNIDLQVNFVQQLQFGDIDNFSQFENTCNRVEFSFQSNCDICHCDFFDLNTNQFNFIQGEELEQQSSSEEVLDISSNNLQATSEETQTSTSASEIVIQKTNKRTKKFNKKRSKPTETKKARRSFSKLYTFGNY